MRTRGRPSAAHKAAPVVIEGGFGQPIPPPDDLNERQAEIWRTIVSSEPVAFFATAATQAMLSDYCRHRESAEKIGDVLNQFETRWLKSGPAVKRYYQLVKLREVETKMCSNIATKLRLTNQSRYVPHVAATAAKNAPKGPKPWD